MFAHYSEQTQHLSSVAAEVDKGKTAAAVVSKNVTFVDCDVSAWEGMSTVMFVHPRLMVCCFFTNL